MYGGPCAFQKGRSSYGWGNISACMALSLVVMDSSHILREFHLESLMDNITALKLRKRGLPVKE
jgi:hypothetical protein